MPRLELFQRTLSEGLLEFDRAIIASPGGSHTEWHTGTAEQHNWKKLLFCEKLLSALKLNPWDLTTAMAIYFTLFSLAKLRRGYNGHIRAFLLDFGAKPDVGDPTVRESFEEIRMLETLKDIERHLRHPEFPIPSYTERNSMSVRDWITVAKDIFVDVVARNKVYGEQDVHHIVGKLGDSFLSLKIL